MSNQEHRGLGQQLTDMLAQGAAQFMAAQMRNMPVPPMSPEAVEEEKSLLARLHAAPDSEKRIIINRLAEFGQIMSASELVPLAMTGSPEVKKASQAALEQIQLRLSGRPTAGRPVPPPPLVSRGGTPPPPPPTVIRPPLGAPPPPPRVSAPPPEPVAPRRQVKRRSPERPAAPASVAGATDAPVVHGEPMPQPQPLTPAGQPELPVAAALPGLGAMPESMPQLPAMAPLPEVSAAVPPPQ